MERLRSRYLSVPLTAVLHPASLGVQEAVTQQKAAAEAAPAVQENELTAQQWFERGFAALDIDEQLRFNSEAIRLKPDYVEAFTNRGAARHDKGDLAGAIEDYSAAIRLRPNVAEAFNNRGITRRAQGDLKGAIQDYCEAIRLQPDYADALIGRGNARSNQGDVAGAIQDYNEAIRLKPNLALAFYNRGIARKAQGDLRGADEDLQRAKRLKQLSTKESGSGK